MGAAYLAGAMVPVLPVLFGATNAFWSIVAAGLMVIVVSAILSFLSGMDIRRRILLNLLIITLAVSISYVIGLLANSSGVFRYNERAHGTAGTDMAKIYIGLSGYPTKPGRRQTTLSARYQGLRFLSVLSARYSTVNWMASGIVCRECG